MRYFDGDTQLDTISKLPTDRHLLFLNNSFWFTFIVNLCLRFPKKGPRPKWTIYKHVSDKSKKCLSVLGCVLAPAYISLCRGLKYSPKDRYIILVDPLRSRFLIFESVFQDRTATLSYVWEIHHKHERHLRLVAHIFTKLLQSVYLSNTHILIYWYARCDSK